MPATVRIDHRQRGLRFIGKEASGCLQRNLANSQLSPFPKPIRGRWVKMSDKHVSRVQSKPAATWPTFCCSIHPSIGTYTSLLLHASFCCLCTLLLLHAPFYRSIHPSFAPYTLLLLHTPLYCSLHPCIAPCTLVLLHTPFNCSIYPSTTPYTRMLLHTFFFLLLHGPFC